MDALVSYALLFSSAFFAASLLPLQSEAIFTAMVINGKYQAWFLLLVASIGNVLGALLNWWLGKQLLRYQQRQWFPVKPERLQKAQTIYQRYGYWSLLGSWLPVIGDPITLIAGVMREPYWRFLLLVTIAKTARYTALLYASLLLFNR